MNAPSGIPAPSSDAKLHFLMSLEAPGDAGDTGERAELVETHMSWVVLHGPYALKLKKPVRYDFLDFSTPEARRRDAEAELRLNWRLAPQVYLGVRALQWHDGEFALVPAEDLPAPGATVDWVLVMQRLPAELMLDRQLSSGTVQPAEIDTLADRLIAFYRDAPRAAVSAEDYLARVQREQRENRAVLLMPRFRDVDAAAPVDAVDAALAAHAGLLQERVRSGRIIEGHGDLRPEHVGMLQPPVVIDCLEFDAALREIDPFDELAYLGMECEVAGNAWIGPRLWARCSAGLGDVPPPALGPLHAARRALLRARLALAHLLDPAPRTPERWVPRARQYLARASAALGRIPAA
ncbi:hypothetical protein [Ideonella sp.]|uniref:hypothetical protein n=1 Tax=Ideonella sp. TaxID=1929293 RepID=UPI002B46A20D|nr:hypothetical protein [Ideonella sp.]HJV68442.1 hypothetical protein [Ideonella sp.]